MKGHDSFHASHPSKCKGCGGRISRGENVWAPGVKGQFYTGVSQGMFHIRCEPPVVVKQMTEEQQTALLERAAAKRVHAYR